MTICPQTNRYTCSHCKIQHTVHPKLVLAFGMAANFILFSSSVVPLTQYAWTMVEHRSDGKSQMSSFISSLTGIKYAFFRYPDIVPAFFSLPTSTNYRYKHQHRFRVHIQVSDYYSRSFIIIYKYTCTCFNSEIKWPGLYQLLVSFIHWNLDVVVVATFWKKSWTILVIVICFW